MRPGYLTYPIIVEYLGALFDTVGHNVVQVTREIDLGTVSQMPSMTAIHTQNSCTRPDERLVSGKVSLASCMGLDICMVGTEQRHCATDSQAFNVVDDATTAVVPFPRIPLGVLIREQTPLGQTDSQRDVVLRCNEIDSPSLPFVLGLDEVRYLRIRRNKRVQEGVRIHVRVYYTLVHRVRSNMGAPLFRFDSLIGAC